MADRLAAHVGHKMPFGAAFAPIRCSRRRRPCRWCSSIQSSVQQLALPVHGAGVVAFLLGDPQAVLRRRDRVGIALGTLEGVVIFALRSGWARRAPQPAA
jgi:hypothetical protein